MSLLEIIRAEIEASQRERRDFSFSSTVKMQLLSTYGLDAVRDTLMQEIRRVGMPCIDPFNPDQDVSALISRVKKEAAKMGTDTKGGGTESSAWTFKGAEGHEGLEGQDAKKSILLTPSTSSGMLSTYFSGYERYHEKCHKSPTPAENWARDELLAKRIVKNLTYPGNAKEALSRNRLRVGCMQMYGCHYPTAFPISVALWIYQREAQRRPAGKFIVIDPCAGWADRLGKFFFWLSFLWVWREAEGPRFMRTKLTKKVSRGMHFGRGY